MTAPLRAWLAILQAGQTGALAWLDAFRQFGGPAGVPEASTSRLSACGLTTETITRLRQPDAERIAAWQGWLEQPGHGLVTCDDPRWPPRLTDTRDPPLALWLRGQRIELLSAPQIAIVGARNATAGGAANAREFAASFGHSGLTIVSGLAAGIDAAAHAGALHTTGGTIAVLGNGIDEIYPHENKALAGQIEDTGLIISEYPPGTPPRRHRFPARNRIIASLSLGVLVVEAGPRSGSLITARLAGEYGREIFAIPGSIHNPVARGCHRLIRDGAKLVETADDVLAELAPALRQALEQPADDAAASPEVPSSVLHNPPQSATTPAPEYLDLLEKMGFDPVGIGEIVNRTALTTAEVSSMLLLLELEGHVEALPGGRYARTE